MNKPLQNFKRIQLVTIMMMAIMFGTGHLRASDHDLDDFQSIIVKGHVTSGEDQSDLPGVNVIVKGTALGTVTDSQGNYSLEVPSNSSVLVFSYIGFTSTEVSVGGQTILDIALTVDSRALEEIVVVGYGTQRKADVTGSVTTFNTDQVQERPLARLDQALVGQMAGVRVQQTSGIPGRGFSIQVRGMGSISANNEPLYVVDGFPLEPSPQNQNGQFTTANPLDNINPNDIESLQVLKDASAAAIYGSRASNGVVIIKTKSGSFGGKPKLTFSAYTGTSQTVKKLDVMSSEEWVDRSIEMINAAWVGSGPGRLATQTTAQRQAILGTTGINNNFMIDDRWTQPGHPGLDYVDWQDLLFKTGITQNYEVSGTGGNDMLKYFVSGGYLDQEGVAIRLGYKRFGARANVEIKASDKLKFGVNVAPSYSIASNPGVDGKDQQLHNAASTAPVVESSVGPYGNAVGTNTNYLWGQNRAPIPYIMKAIGETKIFRTLNTVYGEYSIIKNLVLRSTLNFDNEDGTVKSWIPAEVVASRATTGTLSGFRRQNFVNENTLSYSTKLGGSHSISALAGFSYNYFKYDSWQVNGGTFSSDDITTLNAATITSGTSFETRNILLSYFGRVQYSFNDRYLFTGTIRTDGSSKFGNSTKWGVFPSVSAGWRISEENFLKDLGFLSDLKLRASWGIAGNNGFIAGPNGSTSDYGSIGLLQFSNTSFGGAVAKGLSPQNFPNPNLSWEKSQTINIGLDVGVIENRVHASFDYYTKNNTDLLLSIPVPTATGFSTALTNIGEVLNTGWEVELHTRNTVGIFQWSTDFNISHNTNEVKKLGPNGTPIYDNGGFDIEHRVMQIGYPMNTLFLVQQDGLLSQADITAGAAMFNTESPGDPKYVDANFDGRIDQNDRVLMGGPFPKYIWGFTNTFKYKGFDLNILIQGQNGGQIYSMFGRAMDRTGQGYMDNTLGKYADRWRSEADPGNGLHKVYSTFGRIKNTDWLYSSDYIRVRNITLGYNLAPLLKSKTISAARVYVTAENWFGSDKYDGGYNPEAVNTSGEDYGGFPLSKSMIIGVNLTF